jgi:hypothetical protein
VVVVVVVDTDHANSHPTDYPDEFEGRCDGVPNTSHNLSCSLHTIHSLLRKAFGESIETLCGKELVMSVLIQYQAVAAVAVGSPVHRTVADRAESVVAVVAVVEAVAGTDQHLEEHSIKQKAIVTKTDDSTEI